MTAIRRKLNLLQHVSEWRNQRPPAQSLALTQAANAPGQAAAGAADTAHAANDPDPAATESAAASTPGATVTTGTAAAAAASVAATAAMATAAASAGHLHAATANVFPVEEIERSKADVGHFLLAENEAMVGEAIVGLRDIGTRHRRCGCAAHQRKTQSGGTQCADGSGFARAFCCRSLLDPWHDRVLQNERGSTCRACARRARRARVAGGTNAKYLVSSHSSS